ncbi:MAG: Crp/Fnr family transcriptional regulator [Paracoccaceae bacterium]
MPQSILKELATYPLFEDVSAERLAYLNLKPSDRTYEPGQVIVAREDLGRDVYFLRSGRVLAVYWTEDGRELIFGRIEPGAYFGEMAALDNATRSLSIYAHRKTEVIALTQADFLKLINEIPEIRHHVFRDLVARIRQMIDSNYQLASLSVAMRVRAYLVRTALEAGVLVEEGEIRDPPTHLEIANSVGSNREAVSRVMAELKRSGLIDSGRRHIRLLRPTELVEQVV